MKSRLVWKLSASVIVIMTAAILLSGYANSIIGAHYSLESARAFLRFDSESMINGIGQLMMSRNNEGIKNLIVEMSKDSAVYRDIRLVSHPDGEVVASRFGVQGIRLDPEDRACAVCHARGIPAGDEAKIVDTVIEISGGDRLLSVMAPILNEPGCRSAACHAHSDSPPVLGFLHTDYSLQPMDSMVAARRTLIIGSVIGALLLGVVALRFMFVRLLEKPINELIAGTHRIAASHLDFRFEGKRTDEIGTLEKSFNAMAARIQDHRDELRTTMEYLSGIVENSPDIIVTATPEGFIETFNRGAERALGYSRVEMIGRQVETLFADPREREVAIARLRDDDAVKNYETRFLTKDGQVRNVLLTLAHLRDRDGNPIGTFGISKDITQEKELLRKLVQSQKFAAIGQAVTGIQHGIKNMLNSLKGGSYLIQVGIKNKDMEQIGDGSAMLEEGIELIGGLSRHMLDFAKEWKLDPKRVDVADLVSKVCELNRQTATDRGVTLRSEAEDDLPEVLCDPELLHLAVTDILVNAVDACDWKEYTSEETPEVTLKSSLTRGGSSLLVEIRDNGCGMTEEIRRNIFTPFFSTKKSRGTGLGLALTARIINVHGGEISVESEPDRGTVFRIRLPIDGSKDNWEAANGQAGSRS